MIDKTDPQWSPRRLAENEKNGQSAYGSSIFRSQSLLTKNDTIPEFEHIKNGIEKVLQEHREKKSNDDMEKIIPTMYIAGRNISPKLPCVIFQTIVGNNKYLGAFMFYKKNTMLDARPDNYSGQYLEDGKMYPDRYMDKNLIANTLAGFTSDENMKVSLVTIKFIDITDYLHTLGIDGSLKYIVHEVFNEWYCAMHNITFQKAALAAPAKEEGNHTPQIPGFFSANNEGLFKHDHVGSVQIKNIWSPSDLIETFGRTEPYNVSVLLKSANRNTLDRLGDYRQDEELIAETFLNVDLDVLSKQKYMANIHSRQYHRPGPLVPVVSIGSTSPLDRFKGNANVVSELIGVFNALTLNNSSTILKIFSRPYHTDNLRHIANMSEVAYLISGSNPPAEERLSAKTATNLTTLTRFIENYVQDRIVYVKDIHLSIGDVSNMITYSRAGALASTANTDPNYRACQVTAEAIKAAFDVITGGEYGRLFKNKEANIWRPGCPIFKSSPVVIPMGTGILDSRVINLEELTAMGLLHPKICRDVYDDVAKYLSIRSSPVSLMYKQRDIKHYLTQVFGDSLNLIGFKVRYGYDDLFLNTVAMLIKAGRCDFTNSSIGDNGAMGYSHQAFSFTPSNVTINPTSGGVNVDFNIHNSVG